MPYRVSSSVKNIISYIHPESNKKINDHGGAHGEERDIDKIFTDGGGGNSHFFSNSGAYTKHMPFNKMLNTVHGVKLVQKR
jgi:hypothetical protein